MSFMTMWMTARKQIENWYVWLVVDILETGIYLVKASSSTQCCTAFISARRSGWWAWRSSQRRQPDGRWSRECSGKTTLARALAVRLGTPWCGYARSFWPDARGIRVRRARLRGQRAEQAARDRPSAHHCRYGSGRDQNLVGRALANPMRGSTPRCTRSECAEPASLSAAAARLPVGRRSFAAKTDDRTVLHERYRVAR